MDIVDRWTPTDCHLIGYSRTAGLSLLEGLAETIIHTDKQTLERMKTQSCIGSGPPACPCSAWKARSLFLKRDGRTKSHPRASRASSFLRSGSWRNDSSFILILAPDRTGCLRTNAHTDPHPLIQWDYLPMDCPNSRNRKSSSGSSSSASSS